MTPAEVWANGLVEELAFWERVLTQGDKDYPEADRARRDPTTPLQPDLIRLLPDKSKVRILDVGAGPMTVVGKVWPGHEVEIVPIDPLAKEYNAILDRLGNVPPVRTRYGDAEIGAVDLGPFDLVYARNSLDHGWDPVVAIRRLLMFYAPVMRLEHVERVATKERHHGLHQWDLYQDAQHLVLEGYGAKHRLLADEIETRDGWVYATLLRPP